MGLSVAKGEAMKVELKHLLQDKDRHGNGRIYYRRKGQKMVRLYATPGTPEFLKEYEAARDGNAKPKANGPRNEIELAKPNSLRWLVEGYYKSAYFLTLGGSTQRVRRLILESICTGIVATSRGEFERGNLPFAEMRPKHVRQIRDEKLDKPEAANGRLKALGQVFAWAIEEEIATTDPTADITRLHGRDGGWHTWTVEEVRQFENHFPIGTKPRLALAVLLCTGTRRSDAVRLGKQFERDETLHFTEVKNSKTRAITKKKRPKAKKRVLPILPELREIIDASETGDLVYIVSALGTPFTPESFGNWFHDRCVEAGLSHCSAHGLRKAGAKIAAENGATTHQLMSIYGWETLKQAEVYTREANMIAMAEGAMHLIVPRKKNKESA
ncbi:tyrosine-type recombinase/integrase [Reyranella massiliensis]|uniref:tyrosine-type recombinase/integrase n=1 Tax=Reyranella massiliensis TaxID=445220 RepID=UPI000307BC46|nr:tyrosine-type recombinase/integrase [Reyranella massiliensis]